MENVATDSKFVRVELHIYI